MRLRLISRGSDLAQLQASLVGTRDSRGAALSWTLNGSRGPRWPTAMHRLVSGNRPTGVFTADISEALVSGQADIAVHSWKDLPVTGFEGTTVAGTLPRADPTGRVAHPPRGSRQPAAGAGSTDVLAATGLADGAKPGMATALARLGGCAGPGPRKHPDTPRPARRGPVPCARRSKGSAGQAPARLTPTSSARQAVRAALDSEFVDGLAAAGVSDGAGTGRARARSRDGPARSRGAGACRHARTNPSGRGRRTRDSGELWRRMPRRDWRDGPDS